MRRFNPDKELNKIQKGNRTRVILFVISLLVVGIMGYSFALYQVRYSKRIIYTKVAPFSNKDIELAIYLDDAPSSDNLFPNKNDGYLYSKTVCDNGSRASFDNVNWELNLKSKGKDKCDVYFVTNKGEPNPPELYKGLIPVTFGDNGKVYVANLANNDWYNYDEKRWANAVLVNTAKYGDLVYNGSIKEDKYETEISMSDILQMYVWIPRYKYQLFNVNNDGVPEQEIKIQFENGTANTGDIECKYTNNNDGTITEKCTQKGTETDAQNGDWYMHPAFTFKGTFEENGTELLGIWVGKFENSGSTTDIKILPNVVALTNYNFYNMFNASRQIEETYSAKFNLDKTQIDTHVIKNIDWGAMAYLTQSKYGRCDGQGSCTEVASNARTDYKTGYNGTTYTWETAEGQKASTTGNIYGIYGTNGGAWDYVMGNMVNASGAFYSSSSGFSSAPDSKYYDVYEYDSSSLVTHQRGHLGDAMRETLEQYGYNPGSWYEDYSWFPYGQYSFWGRGGTYNSGNQGGIFSYRPHTGWALVGNGFRSVLTAV